jgi:tRNA threonylcarbamoyladenosine biosynthesis protein TsaB
MGGTVNIIAIDTAADVLSAALFAAGHTWYYEIDAGLRHSELLMDAIDALLEGAGFSRRDLELAACMKGPGSFTGLRIGFAAAKGLALALDIPMVSVPTLDCMAFPQSVWPGIVLPAIDAKKHCYYAALYRGGERLTDYMDAPAEHIARSLKSLFENAAEPVLLTGPGGKQLLAELKAFVPPERLTEDPEGRRGRARELLEIIKQRNMTGSESELHSGPMYLRKSDAELKG